MAVETFHIHQLKFEHVHFWKNIPPTDLCIPLAAVVRNYECVLWDSARQQLQKAVPGIFALHRRHLKTRPCVKGHDFIFDQRRGWRRHLKKTANDSACGSPNPPHSFMCLGCTPLASCMSSRKCQPHSVEGRQWWSKQNLCAAQDRKNGSMMIHDPKTTSSPGHSLLDDVSKLLCNHLVSSQQGAAAIALKAGSWPTSSSSTGTASHMELVPNLHPRHILTH